jgi:hypothetical protein
MTSFPLPDLEWVLLGIATIALAVIREVWPGQERSPARTSVDVLFLVLFVVTIAFTVERIVAAP